MKSSLDLVEGNFLARLRMALVIARDRYPQREQKGAAQYALTSKRGTRSCALKG